MNSVIIDVREKDEFDAEHVENSIHIPLSEFDQRAPSILKALSHKTVIFMCRSGKRAELAASEATKLRNDLSLEVFQGGILEWKRQGNPTVASRGFYLPIMRQVQLIAGSLVVASSLLAYFFNSKFILISSFLGAGLTVAGLTGFCGLAELLSKMPWNQSRPNYQPNPHKDQYDVHVKSSTCSET